MRDSVNCGGLGKRSLHPVKFVRMLLYDWWLYNCTGSDNHKFRLAIKLLYGVCAVARSVLSQGQQQLLKRWLFVGFQFGGHFHCSERAKEANKYSDTELETDDSKGQVQVQLDCKYRDDVSQIIMVRYAWFLLCFLMSALSISNKFKFLGFLNMAWLEQSSHFRCCGTVLPHPF